MLALGVAMLGAPAAATPTHRLTLDLRNSSGTHIESRVSARSDSFAVWYPIEPDTATMAHQGYAYTPTNSGGLVLPEGWTTLCVSHGPEWVPDTRRLYLRRDTTVTVQLPRFLDMRSRGFYSADLHAHTLHDPVEFVVSPRNARRVARAEDLGILHLLDGDYRFTGAPDSLSDKNTLLYYSYEYRHMTYGHVVLPGLRQPVTWGCCLAPAEAWPRLEDLEPQVAGPGRALFVLAHPVTTEEYDEDTDWPGTGLGREYPLLASEGLLDGFEVASYSNFPNDRWPDWYDALSAGLALTPTAGTDALLDHFSHLPAGGWRVYADLGAGAPLDYNAWIEAARAGRTFVTSLPLVPRFRVNGVGPGGTLEAAADTSSLSLSFEVACVTGLEKASLVCERGTVWSVDLSRRSPAMTRLDTTFTLRTATPGWLALRVDGVAGHRMLLGLPAVAHTNAVRLLSGGLPRRDPAACGRMLDRVDALEALLDVRRGWSASWHEDSVFAEIGRARARFGTVFRHAPSGFQLLTADGASTTRIRWAGASDDETGDKVRYRVTVAADSAFTQASVFYSDAPWIESTPARPGLPSWWRVEAVDRGGNVTACEPAAFRATLLVANAGALPDAAVARPRAWPNPSRGPVRLRGLGPDAMILDLAGRCVASRGEGLRAEGAWWVWDGREHGRRVRPGLYWAVSRSRRVSLPLTRLE